MSAPVVQTEDGTLFSSSASENDVQAVDTPSRGRRVVVLALGLGVLAAMCALVSLRGGDGLLTRYVSGGAVQLDSIPNETFCATLFRAVDSGVDSLDGACEVLPEGQTVCHNSQAGIPCTVEVVCSGGKGTGSACCEGVGCKSYGATATCFPGEATVNVEGKGLAPISTLQIGDKVLAQKRSGVLHYERVLGFLHHAVAVQGSFVQLSLSSGEFRATSNHLVLTAERGVQVSRTVGELRVGDKLFVGEATSEVRAVAEGSTNLGMFSPLTSSGTIVVDDVVASIYAQTSESSTFPHTAAHAFFFLARAYYSLMPSLPLPAREHYMHPFATFLFKQLHLERLLSK